MEHLALDVSDEEIIRLFGSADMAGVDCPVGWPNAFLPFLAGHLNFDVHPVLDYDGIEGRRLLAYRDTDRFVTARTGLIPLSVSADRLAHPAMRCAVIPAKIARDSEPQLAASDDLFDALIASLTARAVALGRTLRPDDGQAEAERTEGWIHLPAGGLSELNGS